MSKEKNVGEEAHTQAAQQEDLLFTAPVMLPVSEAAPSAKVKQSFQDEPKAKRKPSPTLVYGPGVTALSEEFGRTLLSEELGRTMVSEELGRTVVSREAEELGATIFAGGSDEEEGGLNETWVEGSSSGGLQASGSSGGLGVLGWGKKTLRAKQIRRYADGALTTATGNREVSLAEGEKVFSLPYKSSDVKMRLGAYDILGELGEGGMGVVYKAYSLNLCRYCAVKVMKVGGNVSEAAILRFQNEAMLAARLRHPNIIAVFDSGEEPGVFYFVMDFIEGRSFSDLIEEGTEEALHKGLVVLSKVCRALDYAHKRGIVHRDIKPDNILLDKHDEPYITDFGIAKDREQDLKLTSTQAAMGTPYYMSPEQANGELHRVGPLSDVYSLGATMFHLLTGRVPFVGDSLFSLMLQLLSEEVERPTLVAKRVLGRDLPQALEVICLKAMEKEAGRRYESAAALADDIDAYLAEKPIQARPQTAGERLKKLVKRNRAVFAGVAIVLGLLIVMVLAFGTLLVVNLQRTARSLRDQDRKAALDQAATLQRAIGTNMLEGRADIIRSLVGGLRKDRSIASINVVRVDKTFAYTDLSTRRFVDKRLADPKTLAWIEKHHPRLMGKVSELKRVGFHNIDEASKELTALLEKGETQRFQPKEFSWNQALVSGRPLSFLEEHKAKRVLTVYWPIKNGKPCQACHGEVGKKLYDGYYGSYGTDKLLQSNQMRGMLVVRRSQEDVEARIRENQRAVLMVAAATTVALFWLILIFTRIFDIGLRPQSFGAQGEPKSDE